MESKDYVYIGLIAVTAAVFYWHGYLAARSRRRKVISSMLAHKPAIGRVPMPDMDMDSTQPVSGHRIIRPAGLRRGRKSRIRAVFGVN